MGKDRFLILDFGISISEFSRKVAKSKESGKYIATRPATFQDIAQLNEMIALSARGLSVDYYTENQIESAIKNVFGVDTQLIIDGTCYIEDPLLNPTLFKGKINPNINT